MWRFVWSSLEIIIPLFLLLRRWGCVFVIRKTHMNQPKVWTLAVNLSAQNMNDHRAFVNGLWILMRRDKSVSGVFNERTNTPEFVYKDTYYFPGFERRVIRLFVQSRNVLYVIWEVWFLRFVFITPLVILIKSSDPTDFFVGLKSEDLNTCASIEHLICVVMCFNLLLWFWFVALSLHHDRLLFWVIKYLKNERRISMSYMMK